MAFRRAPAPGAGVPTITRIDWSGAAERLLFALVVFLAALPLTHWTWPAAWLATMVAAILAERAWGARRGVEGAILSWLPNAGLALAGFWFVLFYTGVPQTFGVTLYGVVIFRIIARDYDHPRRLAFNLVPPVLAVALAQAAATVGIFARHQPLELITLLASPFVVFLACRAVQQDLARNHRRAAEATLRAQAAARRINEAHRIALMAEKMAGVGHWSLDVARRVSTWSDTVYQIHGLDPAGDVPSLDVTLQLYSEADRKIVREYVDRAVLDGAPFSYEARITRADGSVAHIVSSGAAERGPDGRIATVFGTFMDVTERRQREAALRRSEERFRMLADHSTDIIVWVTVDGEVLYVSPSVKALGYRPEQIVGRNLGEFIHPGDREQALAVHEAFFAGGTDSVAKRPEYRLTASDGREVWFEASATLAPAANGRSASAVTSLRNVTARRKLEADLIDAKLRAEAAAEAKAEFLANMSHEIRTPLTGIIGFSGLLSETPDLPQSARTYVQRIASSGRALLSVVNDILDFSKLEARQVELDPQPFDVRGFFDDTVAMFSGQAAAKGLALRLEIDPETPEALDADSARLRQVVANLLSNAIKFTDEGSVRIAAGFDASAGRLKVAVEDTGPGVAPDKLDRLFQRFSQVDGSVSRRHGGTGLGLSICKALVELMGGEIGVVSKVRAGTTFSFWIAAAPATLDRRADAADVEPPAADEAGARILVVDDLDVNRELVRAVLEAAGHDVEEASSGAEAVETAIASPFDLILMDLQMPGMDGFSAARAIRNLAAANQLTPIIALSANVLPEHVAACAEAGMNDHVGKPIAPVELIGAVAHWTQPGVRAEMEAELRDRA